LPLLKFQPSYVVGRDGAVIIATRYGVEGPGFESRWMRYFPQLSRPTLGATRPPLRWVTGLFLWG